MDVDPGGHPIGLKPVGGFDDRPRGLSACTMMSTASHPVSATPPDNARVVAPIFLVGAERSGTTLLRLILSHHPQITWMNEFEYAVDQMDDPNAWPEMDSYAAWLDQHRIFGATELALDQTLAYPDAVDDFLVQWRCRSARPFIGATVHRHFDRLLRIWPDARFIHLIRDPRDVARSRIQMGWEGDFYHAAKVWIDAEQLWDRLAGSLPADRWIEAKYEEIVEAPKFHLARLCEFMDVEYDASMLEFHRDTTYDPIDPRLTCQWRRKLSDAQVQLIESESIEMMRQRGYEPSGLPRISVNAATRERLRMVTRWYCLRFRLKRFGWRLWLADVISRRLGTQRWRRDVRIRMNEVGQKHIK